MERLRNGIYATAMNMRIMNAYEEMEDEDFANGFLNCWLTYGVPDGNELVDNIDDFGNQKDFDELCRDYQEICQKAKICPNFEKYIKEIMENISKMLDNPYYFVV